MLSVAQNVQKRQTEKGEKRFTPEKCYGSLSKYNDEPMDKSQESNYIL